MSTNTTTTRYGPDVLQALKSRDDVRTFLAAGALADAAELIADGMDRAQLTQAQLAERLGVTRATVNGILSGSQNLTLSTLVRVLIELGLEIKISSRKASEQIEEVYLRSLRSMNQRSAGRARERGLAAERAPVRGDTAARRAPARSGGAKTKRKTAKG
jgi:transcriptional regulator with XRE-family HTH domain